MKASDLLKAAAGEVRSEFSAAGGPGACPICNGSPEQQRTYPGKGENPAGCCRVCWFRYGRAIPSKYNNRKPEQKIYGEW